MVPTNVPTPSSLVWDRPAATTLHWEGSGDHLPQQIRPANDKQQSLVTHTVQQVIWVGVSCCYLDELQDKNIVYTTRCTVRCFGNMLHPYNTIMRHLKPIYIWNSAAMHGSRLSLHTLGFYLDLSYAVQCSSLWAEWKEVLAGASELMSEAAQGGPEGSPPLPVHFQCVFYSPANHGHPHPVPTTHYKQAHPALPLNAT